MEITIKDIARDAGVSVSTVSRVMNQSKTVSEELKQKVTKSIEKYNYRPSAAARSLVTKSSSMIAILEADVSNPSIAQFLKQMSNVCMQHDKDVIFCDYNFDTKKAIKLLDKMKERNIDGLIFQGAELDPEIIEHLKMFSCPVVVSAWNGKKDRDFTTVSTDSYAIYKDVVNFLLKDGHEKIAYIGGPKGDYINGQLRLQGYLDAMKEAGKEIENCYIYQGEFTTESGIYGMRKIYETSHQLPTAVVTGSDLIAIGVIRYLKTHRIQVPEEISVFGMDDSVGEIYDPALTTVRMSQQGEIFYDALFGEHAGEKKWFCYPYQIIRRSSTKKLQ